MWVRFPVILTCSSLILTACASLSTPKLPAVAPVQPIAPTTASRLAYHVFIGELALQRGDDRVAARQYAQAGRLGRDPDLAALATMLAYLRGDNVLALGLSRRWLALAPDDSAALHVKAVLDTRLGRIQEAVSEFRHLLGKTPGGNIVLIGETLEKETQPPQALPVMQKLAASYPESAEAHYALARLALRDHQTDLAVREARSAVKLKPEWNAAVVLESNALVAQGHGEVAVRLLRARTQSAPDNLRLHLAYAATLAELGDVTLAHTEFSAVLKRAPRNPDALYSLGLLALQNKQLGVAHTYFERLLDTEQRNNDAFYFLGRTAEVSRQYAGALKWYQQVAGGRYWFPAQIATARVLLIEGKADKVRNYVNALVAADPGDGVQFRLQEAQLLSAAGDTQSALDIFTQALRDYSGNADLLYGRALLNESLGNVTVAEADLHAILDGQPDNPDALNALGYILALHTTHYREAHTYIEKALQLKPDDPAIMDSLGWVEFRLGNYAQAVSELRRAYAKSSDPEIAAHLSEALWAAGKKREARSVWNHALKQHPGNAALTKLSLRFSQ